MSDLSTAFAAARKFYNANEHALSDDASLDLAYAVLEAAGDDAVLVAITREDFADSGVRWIHDDANLRIGLEAWTALEAARRHRERNDRKARHAAVLYLPPMAL